jgi:hypothetical protein
MAPPALQPQLQAKLDEYRTARAFDPASWIEAKCAKLNAYMGNAGLKTCVLLRTSQNVAWQNAAWGMQVVRWMPYVRCVTSVSGGIDSAVVLALTAHAKKLSGSPIVNVIGGYHPTPPWHVACMRHYCVDAGTGPWSGKKSRCRELFGRCLPADPLQRMGPRTRKAKR